MIERLKLGRRSYRRTLRKPNQLNNTFSQIRYMLFYICFFPGIELITCTSLAALNDMHAQGLFDVFQEKLRPGYVISGPSGVVRSAPPVPPSSC